MQHQCSTGADHLITDDDKISGGIAVIPVCPYGSIFGEGEYELVQVVCQNKEEQRAGDKPQRPGPARQTIVIRLAEGHGNEQRQHRHK